MLLKIIIICLVAVATSAIPPGYVSSAYALGSQAEHTVRGYGGLSSVSKQAKAIDSPYATVRKTDIRVTNDAAYGPLSYAHHGHAYGSPAIAHGYHHAPAVAHGYHHGPAIAHGYHAGPAFAQGYNAPTLAHGYPAPLGVGGVTYAHRGYAAAPPHATYGYASAPVHPAYGYANAPVHHAPLGYAARGVALPSAHQVAKSVATPGGLGVAYSPATAVSTSSFSGYGVHFGY